MEQAFPSHLISFRQRFVKGPLPPARSRTAAPSLAEMKIQLANKRPDACGPNYRGATIDWIAARIAASPASRRRYLDFL
jgi:hypothetical protein